MNRLFLLISFLNFPAMLIAQVSTDSKPRMSISTVGFMTRDFADPNRTNWLATGQRPLRTVVWYPSDTGGVKESINDPLQFSLPVSAYHDAKLMPGKKYPLILISHGAQGNARQMRWLAYYFASRGYIAAVVNHNGTKDEERSTGSLTLTDFCMWERPQDLSVVLDKLLKDPVFAKSIDTAKIVAAGFSLGGATVIWLSGAILNLHGLETRSPQPPAQFLKEINAHKSMAETDSTVKLSFRHAQDSYQDNRVKAVFALSPAIGQGFDKQGLTGIHVPVQIVVGDQDIVNPIAENAKYYTDNIPSAKKLIVLPGERGHYTKPPLGNERPVELEEVSRIAFDFFNAILYPSDN
jgi:predicted dienelactone hydrolase